MVKKTTRPSNDRNLQQTKTGVFLWVWVGGFNFWMCMNEELQGKSALYCEQKPTEVMMFLWLIYVSINRILLDYVESQQLLHGIIIQLGVC